MANGFHPELSDTAESILNSIMAGIVRIAILAIRNTITVTINTGGTRPDLPHDDLFDSFRHPDREPRKQHSQTSVGSISINERQAAYSFNLQPGGTLCQRQRTDID